MTNNTPLVTYDADVQALYIQPTDAEVLETINLAKGVYLDIDEAAHPVGFGILNADTELLASVPTLPETAELSDLVKSRSA